MYIYKMKLLQKIVSLIIILVIFYFLITKLMANWQKIPFADLRFDISNLIISFVFLSINFLIFVGVWTKIVNALGEDIRPGKAFWVISTSQMAKYVPGGIWYTLGRVYLCKMEKMNGEIVFLSVVIETCLITLTDIAIFLVATIFLRDLTIFNPLLSVVILIVLFILLYPPFLNRLVNFGLRILRRPKINLAISFLQMLKFSIYFLGIWVAQIIGFYFLINSIYPIDISKIVYIAASYTIAWFVGFIAPFAPGGLGVREGMMTLILSTIFPTPLAIAMSFIQRIWITIFEIAVFFIGLSIKRHFNKSKRD